MHNDGTCHAAMKKLEWKTELLNRDHVQIVYIYIYIYIIHIHVYIYIYVYVYMLIYI